MLSDKNREKLTEAFKVLPELDRKLVALKAICCHCTLRNHEKIFVDAVIKSGITDEAGNVLTEKTYQDRVKRPKQPGVSENKSELSIAQERPATVYRFIMQNTIEEKIIALHQRKRNLANELLSEQGVSGKLSNDDLMSLIVSMGANY
jgi:hypothetical protein